MSIIPFSFQANKNDDAFDDFLDSLPEVEELDAEELAELRGKIEDLIAELDAEEPKNENSEAYDLWAEKHEDLEDILDEILDRLDDLG